ncbi:hemerythrin domain-containing protein [Burkholderiaceae bacterium DAT-1]|nr:hemerythrin domain-containing protein [Burkholderiaceae bacterium DAT-1]
MITDTVLGEFAEPMSLLLATHDKMRRMCAVIYGLMDHLSMVGIDESAMAAAREALDFIDHCAVMHHDDEELGLFQALRELDAGLLSRSIDRLESEHRAIESIARPVCKWLEQVAAGLAAAPMRHAVEALVTRLPAHMDEEERLLYGHACLIEPARMAQLAADMHKRRSEQRVLLLDAA